MMARAAMPRRAAPAGFLPLQHPRLVARPPAGAGWIHEIKFDGYRMQLHVAGGRARWFSRNGNDWSDRLPDLSAIAAALPDCVLDGELCVVDEDGAPAFSALRSVMGRRQAGRIDGELVYFAFDVLWVGAEDLRPSPLHARKARLEQLLEGGVGLNAPSFRLVDALPGAGGHDLLTAACRMKLEGIVSKRSDAPYAGGAVRAETWCKAKCRPGQEVVIGGWKTDGSRFKSLMSGVWDNGVFRYTGTIHTGYAGPVVDQLMPKLRALETTRSPFGAGDPPRKTSDVHWARPELVASIELAEWTAAGKVRQASFKGLREDKSAAEVVREHS